MVLFFICSILSACYPVDDLRAMANNEVKITISEVGCRPVELIVPINEEVTVTIDNMTDSDYAWYVLFFDNEGEFDPKDTRNQLAQLHAPKSAETIGAFTAPGIAAKYMTICMPEGDTENIKLINLLVVEPYGD